MDYESHEFKRYADAQEACRSHAARCHSCFIPIIDDEGNPGYFGEACAAGAKLLRVYVDAEKVILGGSHA